MPAERPYLKIGEVAKLLGVSTSLLRFWETEFRILRPKKTRSQQRLYGPADIEKLRQIKRLLKIEGYTIAGARRRLGKAGKDPTAELERELAKTRAELAELRTRFAALCAAVEAEVRELSELAKD